MTEHRLSNPPGGRGYVYYPREELSGTDLRQAMQDALARGEHGIETARIVEVDEPSGRLLDNCGEALYIHSIGRIGIGCGADATWADAPSLAEGIRIYYEEPDLFDRLN